MIIILKFDLNIIVGDIRPSMKNDKYIVKMLSNDSSIVDTEWFCPHGKIVNYHLATLAPYPHFNLCSTKLFMG